MIYATVDTVCNVNDVVAEQLDPFATTARVVVKLNTDWRFHMSAAEARQLASKLDAAADLAEARNATNPDRSS